MARLRFADLECPGDAYRVALDRLAEVGTDLVNARTSEINLVLTGAFGTGKTRIAVHLLRFAYDAILPTTSGEFDFPRFFTARDVAELRFSRSYSAPEDEEDAKALAREALRIAPLVVIDDVGRISGYRGEELFVEGVVEKRYENERGTILTFNELPTEGRFADFLRYFEEVPLAGGSHRG
jgi:DNA replication protein DnaC